MGGVNGPGGRDLRRYRLAMVNPGDAAALELHLTEIDGVPALWHHGQGPYTGGLVLRMGWADESLPGRGHSHMLEHLAMFGLGRPGEHANGQVDATTMLIHATGSPDEVGGFLARVAAQLMNPPTARLADEKGVLRTEDAARGSRLADLKAWRWGMRDYGLEAARELGLEAMSVDSVREWARRFVSRDNAVLWFTGPPPAGLVLGLPAGERQVAPDPLRCVVPELPAFMRTRAELVVVHTLVRRSSDATALTGVLHARLVDELRTNIAAAYSPEAGYQPIDGVTGAIVATSDMVSGRAAEVTERLLTALDALAAPETTATEEELAAYRSTARRGLLDGGRSLAPHAAWNLAHGAPVQAIDELLDELDQVSPASVLGVAREAATRRLAQVPVDLPVPEGWVAAPVSTARNVAGRRYPHRDTSASLTEGPSGLTLVENGQTFTVRYDDLAGMGTWDDGGRVIIGGDGLHIPVNPGLWRKGGPLVRALDVRVAPELVIPLGTRPDTAIPQLPSWGARIRRMFGPVALGAGAILGLAAVALVSTEPIGAATAAIVGVSLLSLDGARRAHDRRTIGGR
jgi:predicted Zn-dependent peptidase